MEDFQRVVDFIPRIEQIAMKFAERHRDDLVANAVIALIQQNGNYKPEIAEYGIWASIVARYSMIRYVNDLSHVRVSRQTKLRFKRGEYQPDSFNSEAIRHATNKTTSINRMFSLTNANALNFIKDVDQQDTLSRINKIKKRLSKQKKSLLKYRYMDGMTAIKTANAMSLTRQRVNQIENEALLEIRKRLWR